MALFKIVITIFYGPEIGALQECCSRFDDQHRYWSFGAFGGTGNMTTIQRRSTQHARVRNSAARRSGGHRQPKNLKY